MSNVTFAVTVGHHIARRDDGSFDAENFARVAQRAEELGFDHFLGVDHVFVPPYWTSVIPEYLVDPLALLTYVGAHTSRIKLPLSCMVVPYRQPFTTAKQIATIDQLTGGRFALGVTPGYLKEEFETFRLPLDERNEMTNEFVRIMIELWTSKNATFNGKYYCFNGINIEPKCHQKPHVPIWVGGSSRNALRRVAEYGDCWNPLGFTVISDEYKAANVQDLSGKALPTGGTTPAKLRRDLGQITQLAEAAGRDISHLQVVVYVGAPTAENGQGGVQSTAEISQAEFMMDQYFEYLGAGATGFVVTVLGATAAECIDELDQFAAETMPKLRSR